MESERRPSAARVYHRISSFSLGGTVLLLVLAAYLGFQLLLFRSNCPFPGPMSTCLPEATYFDGALVAAAGAVVLAIGCILFEGRAKRAQREPPRKSRRTRMTAPLALLGMALIIASVLLAFTPPVQRVYRLGNQDLALVRETDVYVWRAATVQAYAGEVLQGGAITLWFENGSGRFIGASADPPSIVPAGSPLDPGLNDVGDGYPVPRDGLYSILLVSDVCGLIPCTGNYSSISWMNFTATNPTLVPTSQLGTALMGMGSYSGAIFVTRTGPRREPERR